MYLFIHPDDDDEVGQEHDGGGDAEEPEQPPLAHTDLAILQSPPRFEEKKQDKDGSISTIGDPTILQVKMQGPAG